MAVAFDAKMTGGNSSDTLNQEASSASSISSTGMTVGASATLLIMTLVLQRNPDSGTVPSGFAATWDSVSMTLRANATQTVAGQAQAAITFSLVNPNVGNKTLAASWTGTSDAYMSCVSFTGTDTTTGVNASDNATSTTTTQTVTSTTDGATVAVFVVNGGTPTVNFTKIWAEAPLNPGGGATYTLGGTSNGHTFTGGGGTFQTTAGVHVIAATAAAVQPRPAIQQRQAIKRASYF